MNGDRNFLAVPLASRRRQWDSSKEDDNSIHILGNGHLAVMAAGPDILCLFGPPYSSPNILQISTCGDQPLKDTARREIGAAIWQHTLEISHQPALTFLEFAATRIQAYIRLIQCDQPGVTWRITPHPQGGFLSDPHHPKSWFQCLPPGRTLFRDSKISNLWYWHWLVTAGNFQVEMAEHGDILFHALPGQSYLAIIGAQDYPTGILQVEQLLHESAESYLGSTRQYWSSFTFQRQAASSLPEHSSGEIVEDLDGIATLFKAQQAIQGGGIIGWHTPMAYIRDLYGASRGMLKLGMMEDARHLLEFRFSKFQHFGDLRTAELIGTNCVRHTYNDEVEGPAYVLLQARDYFSATNDADTLHNIWPMLEWCWQAQQGQLVNGLLPFNGDETYIPYGLFPLEGELQGSADTTLAFIASGQWVISWAERTQKWPAVYLQTQKRTVTLATEAYRTWFLEHQQGHFTGRIWVNAPEREDWITPPRFRFNVCQGCKAVVAWTERSHTGRYLCPVCMINDKPPGIRFPPPISPGRIGLNSVSLLPDYLKVDILSSDERRTIAERVLQKVRPNGSIPTASAEDAGRELVSKVAYAAGGGPAGPIGELCVGYDPGLLLITLTRLQHPAANQVFHWLVGLLDQAGAWNEYYDGNNQAVRNCIRANAWASGMNAEAAIGYLTNCGN